MDVFYVLGGALVAWAVLVSMLGMARENFPATKASERLVIGLSVLLVVAAIGSAIVATANESDSENDSAMVALSV